MNEQKETFAEKSLSWALGFTLDTIAWIFIFTAWTIMGAVAFWIIKNVVING